MADIFFDKDVDLSFLEGQTLGFIGYGNQGRAQALNLRDSGLEVIAGSGTDWSTKMALEDGITVYGLEEIAQRAEVLFMLVPDEVMPQVYSTNVEPHLREDMVLNFASGYNIAFGLIKPPAFVDVVMVAPRMIGKGVRDTFLRGEGFPSLVAVEQDSSGEAQDRALAIAKGIGSTRTGAILSTFREEAVIDLFSEQSGDMYYLRIMFEVLTEAGCSPEAVLLELYASGELSEMYAAARDMGLWGQLRLHSRTSQYGQQITSKQFMEIEAIRDSLRQVVANIESGEFAREWQKEQQRGLSNLIEVTNDNLQHPMQQAENRLYRKLGRREESLTEATWLMEEEGEESSR